ncbi:MAG: insulinase family protein [Geodermatophilaceae bacterium]|nr:insulinase family protein [Geodermatophilaceae bacterium]
MPVRIPSLPAHPLHRLELDNGLRVVLSPDATAPVVAVAVYYDVGMRSEPLGRTGFAHLFEHVMFQGSAHLPKLEHARQVQGSGGVFNGSTHLDYTNYFEVLPAGALELALFCEADRMAAPLLTQETIDNQIEVVKEEIRVNVLNRPYGAFPWLQLPELLYDSFANTHNGYGDFVDLESASAADAAEFFDSYYAPGNAVLAVGGDFEVDQATDWVHRYFGPIPGRTTPALAGFGESGLSEDRHTEVEDRLAGTPALAIGWRVPDPVGDLEAFLPYVVLSELMSDSDASRLEQRLIHRDHLAIHQAMYLGLFGDPFDARDATALMFQAHHGEHVSAEQLVAAVEDELRSVADGGVSDSELARVQARIAAQLLRQADPVLGRTLGYAAGELIHGRAEFATELPGRLAAVDAGSVGIAAAELQSQHKAVLELRPGARA